MIVRVLIMVLKGKCFIAICPTGVLSGYMMTPTQETVTSYAI